MQILRAFIAVVAGLFLGSLIIYAFQPIGQFILPPPDIYDPADPDIFRKLSADQQYFVLIPLLAAYVAGSLAGGFFAGIINKGTSIKISLLTGFLLFGFTLVNLINFYHPMWFWIASILVYPTFSLLGGFLSRLAKRN